MTDPASARTPKVSVLMITYNHEKYIEQAVRSVMMQETDFDYELVIGEDCSTDSTREIVLRLKEEFPDKIRLLLPEQNLGMIPNFVATYNACTGEYIALCEGDDYWTHPKKLQIQVDYMEAHPECRLCFHSVLFVSEVQPDRSGTQSPPMHMMRPDNSFELRDWLRNPFVSTATTLFRPVHPLPDWYSGLRRSGDWPLFMLLLWNGGRLLYIDYPSPMTVYRQHMGGVSTGTHFDPDIEGKEAKLLANLAEVYWIQASVKPVQRSFLKERLFLQHRRVAEFYVSVGQLSNARSHALKAYLNRPAAFDSDQRKLASVTLRTFPLIHRVVGCVRRNTPATRTNAYRF